MKKPIEIVLQYKELLQDLPALIEQSGVKHKAIYEKLGISKATYFIRIKKVDEWTLGEVETIIRFIYRLE